MSSVTFPGARESVNYSAQDLYQSAVQQDALEQQQAPAPDPPPEPTPPTAKISKRTNARLQLAAALIEADNERIYEKAEYWHLSHPAQSSDDPRPPPPPQPALACQSAIFAPFRDGADPEITRHVRTWSSTTGLSQIIAPEGQRASIDFLGIALPSENRPRSRSDSAMAHSRTDSLLSLAPSGRASVATFRSAGTSQLAQLGDNESLTDWGIDKFLSKEEQQRAAGARAESVAADDRRRSIGDRTDPIKQRATSEIIATGAPSSKLDLLAKIKLYRERQETLPPSQWDGPGPQATKDEVLDHFSSSHAPAASMEEQSGSKIEHDAGDHQSMAAETGGIWSDGAHEATPTAAAHDLFGSELARTLNKGAFSLATSHQLEQAIAATSRTSDPAEESNMVGIGSYSRSQSRRNSVMASPLFQNAPLPRPGVDRRQSDILFQQVEMGLGSGPFAAAAKAVSPRFTTVELPDREPGDTAYTTKQLQNMARNSTFPSYLGINRDLLDDAAEERFEEENEYGQLPKKPKRASISALADDLEKTGGANFQIRLGGDAPPDLSSANWGKPRKKWFRLSTMADAKGRKKTRHDSDAESDAEILGSSLVPPSEEIAPARINDDIDDDFISPPSKGPLRPLGLSVRLPQTIVMPSRLEGTAFAPTTKLAPDEAAAPANQKRHSLHVPDGFVLHEARGGLPPMRSLVVQSASGPQALFAAKTSKKHQQMIANLKAIEVGRTVQVPVAAPRGIGRRAAVPTTALFRNQLVQHDEEREGWGWEAGTRASDTFNPDEELSSDDDDQPLADLKKQQRLAKKAAKKLAKDKRKRKAARRARRAKRQEGDGSGLESLDEDLDLSSTTSEEDASDSDSDVWASDDDKRWVDDHKPAGKLYGKSLLDIATERTVERKSKARFYGQVQLEDEEPTMIKIDDGAANDAASVAPSVAASFRDNPLGYNDTRERMQAIFGADELWDREVAKRKEEEAQDAARAALTLANETSKPPKKEKGIFGRRKKRVAAYSNVVTESSIGVTNATPSETGTNVSAQPPEASVQEEPELAPTLAIDIGDTELVSGDSRTPALLSGEDKAIDEWLIKSEHNSAHEDSDDDDNVPLSQIKKKSVSRPSSFAAFLGVDTRAAENSSDEEMPLAALKEKRARQSVMLGSGALHLDFTGNGKTLLSPPVTISPARSPLGSLQLNKQTEARTTPAKSIVKVEDSSDSEDDLPLGQRHPEAKSALAAIRVTLEQKKAAARESRRLSRVAEKLAARRAAGSHSDQSEHDSDGSEDDRPLGYSHPQAAIIAEQAALIRQLQAESNKSPTTSAFQGQRPVSSMSAFFNPGDPRLSMMSFAGLPQFDGLPASSMGLPPQMRMSMSSPANLLPSPLGFSPGMSALALPPQAIPMQSPSLSAQSMLIDPKSSSIHNWRTQVPPDATAAVTPSGGTSATDS